MRHLKTAWLVVLGLYVLPYLILVLGGSLWLYEHGWLVAWMILWGIMMVAGWPLVKWLRSKSQPPSTARVKPGANWPPSGDRAWPAIEVLAQRVQADDLPLERVDVWRQVLWEVLDTVARHFHPQSKNPALEIPLPYVLKLVELVAQDLRRAVSGYVPAAHILTLNDMRRLERLARRGQQLYTLYRVAYLGINPVAGLLAELRNLAAGKLETASAAEVKRWAVGYCVRKAGFYAIELYSGNLVLDDVEFRAYRSPRAVRDTGRAEAWSQALAGEPLRILVVGQVKSGKSSLINALFGETRAAVDVVPRTRRVQPYVLEREGIERAVILDTAGYEDADNPRQYFDPLREEVLACDLVLVVCSARSAARQADRRLLDELRSFFQEHPDRLMPPVVGVLTHIDQLRPLRQWNPPYDLLHPQDPKAQQIAEALRAVAEDLRLPAEQVVPVCLKEGSVYNVEEVLVPAILESLGEAQRVKYLRCLREFHNEEYWHRLWQQAAASGRLLLRVGKAWAGWKRS